MAYGYDELADAFADTPSFINDTPSRRRQDVVAGLRARGRGVRARQSRRGQRWGRGEHGTCRGCGRELGGRWGGAEVVLPLSPTRTPGRRGADEVDDFDEVELDALIDAAMSSIRGGGSVSRWPRPLSRWPRLLRQAQEAIRRALAAYRARNHRTMLDEIGRAERLLQQANHEVSRVMSGQRVTQVLDMISRALDRLAAARATATGRNIYSRAGVDTFLGAAWNAIRSAVQAVGLEISI